MPDVEELDELTDEERAFLDLLAELVVSAAVREVEEQCEAA